MNADYWYASLYFRRIWKDKLDVVDSFSDKPIIYAQLDNQASIKHQSSKIQL
ncbi:hypothetical protein QTV43_000637 [Vibrio vulnificus]|nr:hypothetical protein [Vibrio vulnificus]